MRILELTDGAYETGNKEYVDADSIARIESFTLTFPIYETQKQMKGIPFFKKEVEVEVYKDCKSLNGSLIFMKGNKDKTYIQESPQTIIDMIKNKQFTVEL